VGGVALLFAGTKCVPIDEGHACCYNKKFGADRDEGCIEFANPICIMADRSEPCGCGPAPLVLAVDYQVDDGCDDGCDSLYPTCV
jgi:hypothetical protein